MFLAEILKNHFHSVAIIGMAKNTGKTYTFNQLVLEGQKLGLKLAVTSIGLDGEERDSLHGHLKPRIQVYPGLIAVTAKALLVQSELDYEVLGATGVATPLGEVVLARVLSRGKLVLAGPGSGWELAALKEELEAVGVDLLLVDGAVDRRSLSAPLVTDTAVLTVGVEAAWDRAQLLDKLRHWLAVLTLPALEDAAASRAFKHAAEHVKLVALAADGSVHHVERSQVYAAEGSLALGGLANAELIYARGMLTDAVLTRILSAAGPASFTLVASDPTAVFLSAGSLNLLASRQVRLRVLQPLHLSAVTVNPFHSRYGYAEPAVLLDDVGRVVHPLPCFDLRLGVRYRPPKEEIHALP